MAAHQAPPSLGFSRQEQWSGLPFPSPMHDSEKWKRSHSVVSDSQQPHGLEPTRLLHPWDFPGKSTRVGCHCLLRPYPIGCFIFLYLGPKRTYLVDKVSGNWSLVLDSFRNDENKRKWIQCVIKEELSPEDGRVSAVMLTVTIMMMLTRGSVVKRLEHF